MTATSTPPEAAATGATAATDQATEALEQATADESALEGAAALKETVVEQTGRLGDIVQQLDAVGFTVADTRLSLWSVLVVVLVLVGVYLFARLATRLAKWTLGKAKRLDETQRVLSEKLVAIAIWALAFFIAIDLLGIDLTALAVFSGAFGLAIGFGLQKTFGNLVAGLILLMDRSIKPGDVIAVTDMAGNESFGQIRKIGIRAISIVTRDRKEYLIPNENLMVNQVENWSYSSRDVRVKAPVGVAYGSDLDLVEKLLFEATVGAPRVLVNPEPTVRLMAFSDSSIDFEIRFWIEDPEDGVNGVRSEVFKRVWRAFQQHGIEMPFPQRDINFKNNEQFEQLIAAISQRLEGRES